MLTRRTRSKTPAHAPAGLQYSRSLLLHSVLPEHLNRLKACREAIHDSPLVRQSVSLPIECDDVIEHLESMDRSMSRIRDVVKAVHERRDRPLPSPYKLLMYLYAADDHVRAAMSSVEQYRPICFDGSSRSRQGHTRVQGELRTVLQTCEKVEIEAGGMLDELLLNSH